VKKKSKKEIITSLVESAQQFRFCGPSDDPDEQTSVTAGYRHLVIQLKRLAGPILPQAIAARLDAIDVEINNLFSAYDAHSEIEALVPDIEAALELLGDDGKRITSEITPRLSEKLEAFQNSLISHATGGGVAAEEYQVNRDELVNHPLLKDIAPSFLRTCRTPGEFWQFIKFKFPTYALRRQYLWDEFRPMFERVDGTKSTPADLVVSTVLEKFDIETVHRVWLKALDRREADPEGAITLARTLLEAVRKQILDHRGQPYEPDSDLPGLYKMASKTLNIAPSQHSEAVFKQILGGCTAVVEGLGALRNRLSDAHGQGKRPVKPAPRHAELAVNLSGAVATFLVADTSSSRDAIKPDGPAACIELIPNLWVKLPPVLDKGAAWGLPQERSRYRCPFTSGGLLRWQVRA
jgi:hypothetical protein